ncbi:MAG: HIT domain-containing protein [Actinomycetes bacterium]
MPGADSWDRIWAPHRQEYLADQAGNFTDDNCPFCITTDVNDELVVFHGVHAFVVMNKYPYTNGHVMVCTVRHVALYDELEASERNEISQLTAQAMRVLRNISGCAGFNIGMNQGKVAGAGVAGHLHQHIVPRWSNDINFMPIVSGTRVMTSAITQTRDLISKAWNDDV